MNQALKAGQKFAIALGCVIALLSLSVSAQTKANEGLVETLYTLKLSRGSELGVMVRKRKDAAPMIAALLFPGYPGILKIRNDDGGIVYDLAGNLLIRARRQLNNEHIFTVLVDCPTDQWTSCDDRYRSSPQHASDIAELIQLIKKVFGAGQVYLLGTSYGTISTSVLARSLQTQIDGAIHTATFTDPRPDPRAHGTLMGPFDWSKTKAPQLFVHHKDDPCDVTTYSSIMKRKGDLPLITVEGSSNSREGPCQAHSPHGFVGRERATMSAISEWIVNRKLVTSVNEE